MCTFFFVSFQMNTFTSRKANDKNDRLPVTNPLDLALVLRAAATILPLPSSTKASRPQSRILEGEKRRDG